MSAIFSSDGKQILTGSYDHTARLWDAASGKEIALLVNLNEFSAAIFSPDQTRILTSYWYGGAMLWDANTFRPIGVLCRTALQSGNHSLLPMVTR